MSKRNRVRKQQAQPRGGPSRAGTSFDMPRKWIIGLLLGLTFCAFANTLTNGFAYDDQTQILQNDFIKDFRNIPKALVTETWFWRVQQDLDPNEQAKPSTPYYRPVFVIYLMLGWSLFGTWAAGWHFVTVLLHVLVVYFLFLVLERVTSDLRVSAIASLLFAVHPLRTESVAWISGVTDLMLALFLLPSFLLYLRYRERGDWKYLAGALGLFLIAVFTKEPAVCLPLFIAAYEVLVVNQDKLLRERVKTALVYGAAFVILAAFYFGMRLYSLGFLFNDQRFRSYPPVMIFLTIPLVLWKYIGLLLFPMNLSLFHETTLVRSPLELRFILPTIGLVALAVALWPLRKSIAARFAILWFGINLLPVLNLSAFSQEFLVQERYVYISSIGFSLLVAMGLLRIPLERWFTFGSRRTAQAAIVALVALALSGKTFAQNTVWKDDMTLWTHGVEVAPDQAMSHYVLGHKYVAKRMPEKAAEHLEMYVQLNPKNLIALSNLAAAHLVAYQFQAAANPATADRAHLDRAVVLCEKGLSIDDRVPMFWDTLGTVYTFDTGLKSYERAIACFERGLRQQPENGMINFHLGATLAKQGKYEDAIRYLESARQFQADLPDVYKFLAYVYREKGQLQLAVDYLSQYLQLQPNAYDEQKVKKEVETLRAQLRSASPQS